jgi:hypothetical protein
LSLWDRCKRFDFLILEAAIASKLPMALSKPQKTGQIAREIG